MTSSTESRPTPAQRLTRGLAHTAAGPVDITRGALGLSANAVAATASSVRQRYRSGQLRKELAAAQEALTRELSTAGEVLAELPETFREARANRRNSKRPWIIAGAVAGTLVLGGAAFAFVRRTKQPEPSSALPPSVQIDPRP
ncbi:cell wall synthesis protein CwsA [[Mycobacterium] burgundiense]|uniref:Cell wall synthesis protein CwsA n=2 Tax=[Mycobacterium] burgundiense TaxID=3064286 RepID=A0ABM9L827_9MYCO|nr:cell wall synthesis protein CwsA [Mycolicibacterium sp. MU0053]CAJ1494348.1 cell wall synthesis protein CwsA [Mycolicibacterium sp. MU0053]